MTQRSAKSGAKSGAKSRLRPHLFIPDPDVPPGPDGRGACATCHLIGEAGDAHHTLPDGGPEQAEHRRWAGENGGER